MGWALLWHSGHKADPAPQSDGQDISIKQEKNALRTVLLLYQ
jgi:hypothetical protein